MSPTPPLKAAEPTDLAAAPDPTRLLREGCQRLRARGGRVLRGFRVGQIAAGVEGAARAWLDRDYPRRREVVCRVAEDTGMAPAVVEHGLDVELSNYTADALMRALRSEIGAPEYLDEFGPNAILGGASRAFGPALIAHWFSGTIPALPALSLVRGLLLKAPGVARLTRREQSFAPAFLATLEEFLPGAGEAIWLTTWPPNLTDCVEVLARECDAAIVYGGPETVARLRPLLAPHLRLVEHGHKVGLGLIGRGGADAAEFASLARACAYDIITFDQRGCISPQVYLVEAGGTVTAEEFATALARAMAAREAEHPPSHQGIDDLVALHLSIQEVRFRGGRAIEAGSGMVLIEPAATGTGPTVGRRVVRVVPVDNLCDALADLPFRQYLQNVSLCAGPEEEGRLLEAVAEAGASRVCRPGRMPHPAVTWHHDGMACLGRLVRWTDAEL